MSNFWSVAQACVWAATRDHIAVREVRPNDMLRALNEGPLIEIAHVIAWRKAVAGVQFPSVLEAAAELLDHCQRGQAELLGRKNGKGTAAPIPVNVLLRLEIDDDSVRKEPIAQPRNTFDTRTGWWSDLTVDCDYVVTLWPDLQPMAALNERSDERSGAPLCGTEDDLQRRLVEWACKVCVVVRDAGKRISKDPFVSLAWDYFGNGSGLTVDRIAGAWTNGRESAGWPRSGTIPAALRIDESELRPLLIDAGLMRPK